MNSTINNHKHIIGSWDGCDESCLVREGDEVEVHDHFKFCPECGENVEHIPTYQYVPKPIKYDPKEVASAWMNTDSECMWHALRDVMNKKSAFLGLLDRKKLPDGCGITYSNIVYQLKDGHWKLKE